MATKLWGSLLGRKSSNAEDIDFVGDQGSGSCKSTRVQTLCAMRTKSSNISSTSTSTSNGALGSAASAGGGSSDSSPDQQTVRPASQSALSPLETGSATDATKLNKTFSPFASMSDASKPPASSNGFSTAAASGLQDTEQQQGSDPAHDSASSSYDTAGSVGHLSRLNSKGKPLGPAAGQQEPSAAAEAAAAFHAVPDAADRTLSLSLGISEHNLPSHLQFNSPPGAAAAAGGASAQQQLQDSSVGPNNSQHIDMSFLPSTRPLNPAGFSTSSAQLQNPGSVTPDGSTPRLSSPLGMDLGLFSTHPGPRAFASGLGSELGSGLGAGLGPSGMEQAGAAAPAGSMQALIADLQATAGLTAEQAAAAAAVMMPCMQLPSLATNPLQASPPASHNPWASSPPGQGFGMHPPLSPTGHLSPMGLRLNPGSNPDVGLLGLGAQADLLGSPAAALGATGAFGGPLVGFDSVHSSTSTNVVSGTGYGLLGGAGGGGLLSPENSYLAEAAQYAHDGLDVPGTAQVAVHNVPFKWCNVDLEDLFKEQEGYLDTQLLFHENGRSKGVGVGLFRDRACAVEACNKLSGAQADGRKLELVLMNPDNHVSFSCRQVAVLGLPWEYTGADVRALLEAAAESDGAPPADAGVEHVEVAYRDDGKSEGRAIATFASRRQAHDAIRRLHGKETLAGLRMRLFYLHEQQQTRNANVLAQLRTQPQLLPALLPGFANLGLGGDPTLSPRQHPQGFYSSYASGTDNTANGNGKNGGGSSTPRGAAAGGNGGSGGSAQGGGEGGGEGQANSSSSGDGANTPRATGATTGEGLEGQGGADEGANSGSGAGGGGVGEGGAVGGASGQTGQSSDGRPAGESEGSEPGRGSFDKDQGPVILHVSGLMESVTREQLRELFSQAGEVTKVDIPDGGRSMGYGFITFSNPQAAEQAMLLFNNYPLGGGAIHVAYSTSATAKARQQALRQARKATLGNSRASTDAGPGRQPGTPRGGGMTNRRGGPGGGGGFFPANPSLGSLGGGSMGGFDGGMNQGGRNSFDAAGYGSGMGGGWSRGPGNVLGGSVPGGLGGGYGGGISSSLGALGGTPPGMHSAAAAMGQGRALRSSFEYGMGGLGGPSALQMLQGAGGTAGYPAGLAPGFDVSTAGNLDQQLQLLMQMTGTGGDPTGAFGALPGGLLGGIPGGQPGTPPPAGGLRGNPLVPGNAGGLFGPPMSAAAAGGPLGALAGLSTPPGAFMSAQGGNPALFGGNPAGAPGGGMFSPSGLPGMGGGFMGGSAGGMAGFGEGAGGHMGGGGQQRQVLVTRLPPGLNEANLRALFEICGPLGAVSKKPEQDFAIITYDTLESARRAISLLDGTKLPSGTTLSLQFTSLMPSLMMPDTPAKTADMPWNPHALSPTGAPGFYGGPGGLGGGRGGGGGAFAPGYATTPPRGSFGGQGGTGGPSSGSLLPVAEAGNTGELYGPPGDLGESSGVLGSSHLGGFGSVGSGLRLGATSPAFGKPPRDGPGPSGPALAAGSGLYSSTSLRSDSPVPGGVGGGVNPNVRGGGGIAASSPGLRGVGGLPPMYAGASAGLTSSGSAGNLFGGGRPGNDGGSAHGSDGSHP